MNFTREFDITISVRCPLKIIVNYEDNLMSILRQRYEKKCLDECIIDEIISINKYTYPMMQNFVDYAVANININFTAKYIILAKDDIIVNARRISSNENYVFTTFNDDRYDYVTRTDRYKDIVSRTNLTYIPLNIMRIDYQTNSKPLITSNIFIYKPFIIRISNKTSTSIAKDVMQSMIDKIKTWSDMIDAYMAKIKEIFIIDESRYSQLMKNIFGKYINGDGAFDKITDKKTYIIDLPNINNGDDILKFYSEIQSKTIFLIPQSSPMNGHKIKVIETEINNCAIGEIRSLHLIWARYLSMIKNIYEFAKVFNTDELINDHKDLWKYYGNSIV